MSVQQPMPNIPPYFYQPKKTKWWIPVLIVGIVLVMFFIGFIAFFGVIGSVLSKPEVEVKDNTVLYLDLGQVVSEKNVSSFWSIFSESQPISFLEIINSIKKAKTDNRINGIYFKANNTMIGYANLAELIEVLEDFKKSNKFIYAYIEVGSTKDYLLALTADKIFMPSEGMLPLTGLGAANLFYKGTMEKIGIDFWVCGFEDFKSAAESYSKKGFSDSSKLQLKVLLNQRQEYIVNTIAKYRKLSKEQIEENLNDGLFSADTLLALGYIDSLATEAQVKDLLKAKVYGNETADLAKKKLRTVSIGNYAGADYDDKGKVTGFDKSIAIIYGVGSLLPDQAANPFSSGEQSITAKEFVKYLRKARDDKNVLAIILRIDSPGGSVITSDVIYQEILRAKEVKPVYASMANVAASGGYYIAMACDTIIAHENTITGSIGVISAIPNVSKLLDNIGITVDTVNTNESSQFMNPYYQFKDNDKAKFYAMSESIYKKFVQKVATARKKSFDEIRAIAKGRVWSGKDALDNGLIDVLGGLQASIDLAKQRIGVPLDTRVRIKTYPPKEDEFKVILKLFGMDDSDDENNAKANVMTQLSQLFSLNIDSFTQAFNMLPEDAKRQMLYQNTLINISKVEPYMVALPYYIAY